MNFRNHINCGGFPAPRAPSMSLSPPPGQTHRDWMWGLGRDPGTDGEYPRVSEKLGRHLLSGGLFSTPSQSLGDPPGPCGRPQMPVFERLPWAEGASPCRGLRGRAGTSRRRTRGVSSHGQAWLVGKRAPSPAGGSSSAEEFEQGWATSGVMGRGLEVDRVLRGAQGASGFQAEPLRGPHSHAWGGVASGGEASCTVVGLPPGVQSHPSL